MSKVTYRLNLARWKRVTDKARNELAEMVLRDTKPYVPNREGKLERSARILDKGRYIRYKTPYARFLWYGKLMLSPSGSSWARRGEKKHVVDIDLNYSQKINPKAGKKWVKRAERDNLENWKRRVKEILGER